MCCGIVTEHEVNEIVDEILVWWGETHHQQDDHASSNANEQQKPRFVMLAEAIDGRRFHV